MSGEQGYRAGIPYAPPEVRAWRWARRPSPTPSCRGPLHAPGRSRPRAARPAHHGRRSRRGGRGERGGPGRRAFRRHRRGGEQRQRDQSRLDGRPGGQALRPDAADQRARHVRGHPGLPAPPARVRARPRAHALAAAVGRPALAARPQRLHAVEDGHDDAHPRPGRRRGGARRRGQLPVAAHDHRDGGGAEPARRRRGDDPGPHPRDHGRRRAGDPGPRPRSCRATPSSTTRCCRGGVVDLERYSASDDAELALDLFVDGGPEPAASSA